MDSGYYAACSGLAAQVQALDVVAHNLANLGTTGYRGQEATFQSLLAASDSVPPNGLNAAVNNFGVLSGSHVDLSAGSLVTTGNPMDLGIEGSGFFVVQSAQGLLYTRNGSFHVTAHGALVTSAGDAVLGEQGTIELPNGAVSISSDGTVSVNGAVVAKIRLVQFAPNIELRAEGDSLYSAPLGTDVPDASSSIRQGMLEQSNVSAVSSVVELIAVQRNAEMMQRALGAFDSEFNQTAVQDLPKV